MWEISELKNRAKDQFRNNYLMCVIVSAILTYFATHGGGGSNVDINIRDFRASRDSLSMLADQAFGSLLPKSISKIMIYFNHAGRAILGFMILLCGICLVIFIFNVIEVGGCSFFVKNAEDKAGFENLIEPFRGENYMNVVKNMLLRYVYLTLWSMLLVIPGIYKSYEYRMVPYLSAEYPELSDRKIFALSKQMMNGSKMNAFILDLSFIGWYILTAITLGIAGILYVGPYKHATDAELYIKLKELKGIN